MPVSSVQMAIGCLALWSPTVPTQPQASLWWPLKTDNLHVIPSCSLWQNLYSRVSCNFWAYLKIKEMINSLMDQDDWSHSEETETSHSACESWWQCKQTVLYSLCIPINCWQYSLIFGKQIGNKMGDEHKDRELPKWWSSTEGTLKVATLDVRQTSTCIKQFNSLMLK